MKTTIWQIIVLILGLALMLVIRVSWQDRLRMDASIEHADCLIRSAEAGVNIDTYCTNIKTFKIKGFNK